MQRACSSSDFAPEPLERRLLLAQTFSATFVGRVPQYVFPDRPAQAAVRVTNAATRSTAARLDLYASPTVDLSSTPFLVAQSAPVTASHQTLHFKFSSTAIPASGPLYLVAQLVPVPTRATAAAAPADVAPAVFAAPRPTRFVAPDVDLTAQLIHQPASPLLVSARGSTRASVGVLVLNAGATTAVGPLTASVYASKNQTFDATAALIGSASVRRVTIPSATARTITVPLTFPAATPPGSYYLFAVVNPSGAIPESDTANNTARSIAPLTITNAAPPSSAHHHHHGYAAGGVGIVESGDVPVDWTTPPDASAPEPEDSDYAPPSDSDNPDTPTTTPSTQPTTEPSDSSSDDDHSTLEGDY
jgi:hypothetical protein